jgi:tetratricopeptide (TPR) repeat protein
LLLARAQGCYWGGDPQLAQGLYEQAGQLLARGGAFHDQLISLHMVRHCRAYVGNTSLEQQAANALVNLSTGVGNAQCICWSHYDAASAAARGGMLHEALSHMQRSNDALAGERYYMTEAIRGSTDAYVRLQLSSYRMARELSANAWRLASKSLIFIDATLLCLPVLVESVAGPDWRSPLSAANARYVKKIMRRASLLYPTIPNHRPHLRRVFGRAYYAMGHQRKAIRYFENAIRISELKGMDYQRAKSLLDLAAVTEEGRNENRAAAIELLKKMESVIPRAESWLLDDQYDEAVVAPEFDLEDLEREHASSSTSEKSD